MDEKCMPDDPRRCQAVTPHGQCQYLAADNDDKCNFHNHGTAQRRAQKNEVERYILDHQELRRSYQRQESDEDYLNLRKEINLLTAMMEKRVNMMKSDADYMMGTSAIMAIAQRLESMKVALLKMRQTMNMTLGVDQLKAIAMSIADILSEELSEIPNKDEIIERIGLRIFQTLEEVASGQKSGDNDG